MAILRVAQMGHPVLRTVAQPVDPSAFGHPVFEQFCDDLIETMDDYDGVGLAAPQVHTSLLIVVLTLDEDRGPELLINPEITFLTDQTRRTVEGCLSVAGMRAVVHRPVQIEVRALGRDGKPLALRLTGMPAVIVQHECDHLDGGLYVDRCETFTLSFLAEYERYGALDLLVEDDEEDEGDSIDEWDDEVVVLPIDEEVS